MAKVDVSKIDYGMLSATEIEVLLKHAREAKKALPKGTPSSVKINNSVKSVEKNVTSALQSIKKLIELHAVEEKKSDIEKQVKRLSNYMTEAPKVADRNPRGAAARKQK